MVLGTHNLGDHGDILVVDDETAVVEVVALYLRRDGFDVRVAHDGLAAQKAIDECLPALVVLDVMLPGLDGLALMRQLRADPEADVPVILLTARSQEADRIYGLELGADDYIGKPFEPRELVARVQAILRRSDSAGPTAGKLSFEGLEIDTESRSVTVDGKSVELTSMEYELLLILARRHGKKLSRDDILGELRGIDAAQFRQITLASEPCNSVTRRLPAR